MNTQIQISIITVYTIYYYTRSRIFSVAVGRCIVGDFSLILVTLFIII